MSQNSQRESDQPYEVVSIRMVDPPPGTEGTDWHRYVIAQGGANVVEGFRQGDLSSVTGDVDQIVAQMNERRVGKRGRVNLAPTPKK